MKSLVQVSAAKALELCDKTEKWLDMMDTKHMNDYIDAVLQAEHKRLWRRIFGKPMPSRAEVEAQFHKDADESWTLWESERRVISGIRNMAATGNPLYLTAEDLSVIS